MNKIYRDAVEDTWVEVDASPSGRVDVKFVAKDEDFDSGEYEIVTFHAGREQCGDLVQWFRGIADAVLLTADRLHSED